MTQQYGRIDSGLVVHHHFRGLSIEAKLLCLFLRATPRGNAIGCFYYPVSQIVDDLGDQLTIEGASKGLLELAERAYAKYCPVTRWVWIPKHLDHFPVLGRNSGKHALDVLETVPRDFAYSSELIDCFDRNHDWANDREAANLDRRWEGLRATFEGASKGLRRGFEGAYSRAAARADLDSSPVEIDSRQLTPADAAVDGSPGDDDTDREPVDDVFAEVLEWGVQHVAEKGPLSRHTAQTFIASRCKLYGEAAVARQLLALQLKPVIEPRSWLDAQLKKGDPHAANASGRRRSAVDAVRDANRAAAAAREH